MDASRRRTGSGAVARRSENVRQLCRCTALSLSFTAHTHLCELSVFLAQLRRLEKIGRAHRADDDDVILQAIPPSVVAGEACIWALEIRLA